MRCLDIGPCHYRLKGFETLDIDKSLKGIDHIANASKPLPFPDDTFDLIHASHILEHIDWRKSGEVLGEWVRILKIGGWIEVWVPDALVICQRFIEMEKSYKGIGNEPCLKLDFQMYPGFVHKALFTERYLKSLMQKTGLKQIQRMPKEKARHPKPLNYYWDLGIKGMK